MTYLIVPLIWLSEFRVQSLALTLTLTLTFENDISCLLYFFYDTHASIISQTLNHFQYMTDGRGPSIFYGGHIGIAQRMVFRSKEFGGTYDMVLTIS